MGLNLEYHQVCDHVLGKEPFPDMDEAFMLVRGEESRSELMGKKDEDSSLATETSALKTNDTKRALVAGRPWSFKRNDQHDNRWCGFCKKPHNTRETCWQLHGKPGNVPNQKA